MTERPILFKDEMVRAILAGRKTQTRRLVRVPADAGPVHIDPGGTVFGPGPYLKFERTANDGGPTMHPRIRCPYGYSGDRLWVKEAFTHITGNGIRVHYRADGEPLGHDGKALPTKPGLRRWSSPLFMPRKLSRVSLEIVEVRVQCVQGVTEDDARAEGVDRDTAPCDHTRHSCEEIGCLGPTYRSTFCELWDKINGKRASWASNPLVWAITFKRIDERARP